VLVAFAVLKSATFELFWMFERPGRGIAHGYVIAIILAALATGPVAALSRPNGCTRYRHGARDRGDARGSPPPLRLAAGTGD